MLRLQVESHKLLIQGLHEEHLESKEIQQKHHNDLYHGNGNPGITVRLIRLEDRFDVAESWQRSVDLYRENVPNLHDQLHKLTATPAVATITSSSTLALNTNLKIALIAAISSVLIALFTKAAPLAGPSLWSMLGTLFSGNR